MINLAELVEEHGVVGAQVAVLHNGEITDMAAGVLNNVTGEEVTTDSLFQIGSITKVWTATLVQQLVNEGLLDLDRPVRDVLPEFTLADEEAARIITPRHLLTHTGGFEGDLWHDTGNGDDMIEKYVERMADARQEVPPGELYTYCNSGFVVLGRIVEVLRGKPFNAVLRERLIDPLGLRTAATSHAEYATRTCATGHLGKDLKPAEKLMTEADAPAGAVLAMSARDLAEFARMHLATTDFDVMRDPLVEVPNFGSAVSQGVGWVVHRYPNGFTGLGTRAGRWASSPTCGWSRKQDSRSPCSPTGDHTCRWCARSCARCWAAWWTVPCPVCPRRLPCRCRSMSRRSSASTGPPPSRRTSPRAPGAG
ncbi:serine hydrolase domain-containing protein [Lentzea sp. NPDC055074]